MIYCFYHVVDLDGHCSGAIVKYFYSKQKQNVRLVPFNYGYTLPLEKFKKEDIVYFVDVVPQPFEDIYKVQGLVDKVIIYDHHKSFIESPVGQDFLMRGDSNLQIGLAGCELTWKKLLPFTKIPLCVELLGEYDSWRDYDKIHWEKTVLPFQYGMRLEKTDPEDNYALWEDWFDSMFQTLRVAGTIDNGHIVLKYEDLQNERIMRQAFEYDFYDANNTAHKCLCVNSTIRNSQLFKSMWDEEKYDFMVAYSQMKKGGWSFSAYTTKKDKDASLIGKHFGGGGHKGAAGWYTDKVEQFFVNRT